MTNSQITYQLTLVRINELRNEATAARLADQVVFGHLAGARASRVRRLRARRSRARGPQPNTAPDTR